MRLWLVYLLSAIASMAAAPTYYVDFDGGNDASAGTSTGTAWRTLPGTRDSNNTAYVTTSYGGGVITSSAKVPAGTTFNLKCGTTLDNTEGGQIRIDSTYWSNGTASLPMVIQADTTWGSGKIVLDGAGITHATSNGRINIDSIPYITIDGKVPNGICITNCYWQAIRAYSNGTNGWVFRNLETANSDKSIIQIYAKDSGATPLYLYDVTLDTIYSHDQRGTDGDNLFLLNWVKGFLVTNCTAAIATNGGPGADGFHFGSCSDGWVESCVAHSVGEQGFDISRDGGFKTRDDSSNITVRACISHNNYQNSYDFNSGSHHIYYVNCYAWKTTSGALGDANFNIHEGTAGNNWWINCSSSKSSDRGWNFSFAGNLYGFPAGTLTNFLINCVSSQDSTSASGSRGGSLWVDADTSTNIMLYTIQNCILNTDSPTYKTVNWKNSATNFTGANIMAGTGGWFGVNCTTNWPIWISTNASSWSLDNLTPDTGSPAISGGDWVLYTDNSGGGTTITTTNNYSLDPSRVLRAGDAIQIQSGGQAKVVSVAANGTIVVDRYVTWGAGKGVWFYNTTGTPFIGAAFPDGLAATSVYSPLSGKITLSGGAKLQ